jgi:hypothetical protein
VIDPAASDWQILQYWQIFQLLNLPNHPQTNYWINDVTIREHSMVELILFLLDILVGGGSGGGGKKAL